MGTLQIFVFFLKERVMVAWRLRRRYEAIYGRFYIKIKKIGRTFGHGLLILPLLPRRKPGLFVPILKTGNRTIACSVKMIGQDLVMDVFEKLPNVQFHIPFVFVGV